MSKKKIYDIVPPKKRKEYFPHLKEAASKNQNRKFLFGLEKGNWRVFKKEIAVGVLGVFFVLGVFWLFSSASHATVFIWPKTNELNLHAGITFATTTQELNLAEQDLSQVEIPAIWLEAEEDFFQEFSAETVKVEEKATGVIRVFNKHSRTVSLVADTRFLSATDPASQFQIQKPISIPADGYVDIEVVASEAGEEHNIGPSTFSIPGLRNFSPPQLYYDVFGKSSERMEGGRVQEVKKITERVLEQAEKKLLETSQKKIKTALQERAGEDFWVIKETIEWEVIESGPAGVIVGQEKDSFTYQNKIKAKALKVAHSDIEAFAVAYIKASIPGTRELAEDSLEIKLLTTDNGSGLFQEVQLLGNVYSKIDVSALKEVMKEKTRNEASGYIMDIAPELRKSPRISFRPFWARRGPSEKEKINVEIRFD